MSISFQLSIFNFSFSIDFMVLNYIWIFFFAVAFIVALFRLVIGGDTEVFSAMMTSTFDMSKTGFEISLG